MIPDLLSQDDTVIVEVDGHEVKVCNKGDTLFMEAIRANLAWLVDQLHNDITRTVVNSTADRDV